MSMSTNSNEFIPPVFRPRLYQGEKDGWIAILLLCIQLLFRVAILSVLVSIWPPRYLRYRIEKQQIVSSATRIFLTRTKILRRRICLKIWQTSTDHFNLYRVNNLEARNRYVYEGLYRNRHYVKGVYLGIAPIRVDEKNLKKGYVLRGRLIRHPQEKDLKSDVEYALVMKYIEEDWRLDYQLLKGGWDTEEGMCFLAREVAKIHENPSDEPVAHVGTSEDILAKLELNIDILEKLLEKFDELYNDPEKQARYQRYRNMINVVRSTAQENKKLFDQRHANGHVRRCHGDLKTSNLWIQPQRSLSGRLRKSPPNLLALDCIDFNRPEFCYIDTLSDVAMLAVDIQWCVTDWSGNNNKGQKLVNLFLETYLKCVKEKPEEVQSLLNYYMVEKAIIFAYISFFYDGFSPDFTERYLDIALLYTQRLNKYHLYIQRPKKRQHRRSGKLSTLQRKSGSLVAVHSR